jgi:hypothetical protein
MRRFRERGWEVTELADPTRMRATRSGEKVTVTWSYVEHLGRAREPFERARYFIDGAEQERPGSIAAVLTLSRGKAAGLGFDPVTDDDATVLRALAGRTIEWTNTMTGRLQSATVPRGGLNLKVAYTNSGRCVSFVDGHWHAVRLAAIKRVV